MAIEIKIIRCQECKKIMLEKQDSDQLRFGHISWIYCPDNPNDDPKNPHSSFYYNKKTKELIL